VEVEQGQVSVQAGTTFELPVSKSKVYSVKSVADYLGVSRWTIYRLVHRGELQSVKLSNRTVFTANEIRRFIETHTVS